MHKSDEVDIFAFKRSRQQYFGRNTPCNILALSSALFPMRTFQIFAADIQLKIYDAFTINMTAALLYTVNSIF